MPSSVRLCVRQIDNVMSAPARTTVHPRVRRTAVATRAASAGPRKLLAKKNGRNYSAEIPNKSAAFSGLSWRQPIIREIAIRLYTTTVVTIRGLTGNNRLVASQEEERLKLLCHLADNALMTHLRQAYGRPT